jgi:Xaa-Pro aminopeptidase
MDHDARIARMRVRLEESGADALIVGPGADLVHLTGYRAMPLERVTMLVVTREGRARLVVPRLERPVAEEALAADVDIVAWEDTEDGVAVVAGLIADHGSRARVAVGPQVWTAVTLALQGHLPTATWMDAGPVLAAGRIVKDRVEVERLRAAAAAIDSVHERVPSIVRSGRSEREVAADIAALIRATHDVVNFVIVASGPNGASPHHEPGERRIEDDDAVVVDIGGTLDGYCSDATRDYVTGRGPSGYHEVHEVLERAQVAACAAVRPGARAQEIDRVARAVIVEAGHGDAFVHRTGHGIGLEEHEAPWIVEGDATELAAGMAFSVEPGIYLEGRFGMRIEDIVVVTDDGVDVLDTRPRHPLVAG